MAKKIGEASGYRAGGGLTRPELGNVQKGSYGSPGGSGKKSRYSEVYGKRPATFGDYFKDAKDKFGKLKKIASKIEGMSKSPESDATPIDLSQVPKGNPISNLETNSITPISSGKKVDPSPRGSDFRFDYENQKDYGSPEKNQRIDALKGRVNYEKAYEAKESAKLSDEDIIDQTEVEGIGDSGVFQKSDAYGKAMMRSGLYQKSYNAKKYK